MITNLLFSKEAKELFPFHPLWLVAEHGLATNGQFGVFLEIVHHVGIIFLEDDVVRCLQAERPYCLLLENGL
ncbi:hypothetical protein DI43_18155 [Geobacillus sp. CAMR12739]|nr:hypothetical protein DI43_18155 [Geobacillus sp. CAMR12739]